MTTGKKLVEIANQHIGEKYIFGSKVPYNNLNYTGPWDCAEFISWCVYKATDLLIGVKNGEAYTGFWAADAKTKCTEISIEKATITPGAILLRIPNGSMIGHIVFSDGKSQTVEAMSSKKGVTNGIITGRTWHKALLINGVSYTENLETITKTYKEPKYYFFLNTIPIKDPLILKAKQALLKLGINPGNLNDSYDLNMQIAVHNYQLMKGLIVDGIMGKQTLKSLKVI
ncbi:MAG: peptidoglycan-binding domain-containing protein [Flavobacterium sp.]